VTAAYAFILASLIVERLFDPLLVIPACAAGLLCRRWWHLAIAAAVIAGLVEAVRYINNFHPALVGVAWFAALAWGSLVYGIKRLLSRRAATVSGKAPSS
jgi:hypothetical protein